MNIILICIKDSNFYAILTNEELFSKKPNLCKAGDKYKKTSELFGVLGDYPYLCQKNE